MTNWINLILAGKNHRSKYRLVFKKKQLEIACYNGTLYIS